METDYTLISIHDRGKCDECPAAARYAVVAHEYPDDPEEMPSHYETSQLCNGCSESARDVGLAWQ